MKGKDIKEIKSITLEKAIKYCMMAKDFVKNGWPPIAITVVDVRGMVLCTMAMDDTLPISPALSIRKAITALHLKIATIELQKRKTNVANLGENYCCFGGGIPITEDDEIIGAIGISGCKTGEDDDMLALRILVVLEHTEMK